MRISLPPVTRGLLVAMTAFSFLYAVARYGPSLSGNQVSRTASPYLALIPSLSFFYPWTLFTSPFVEQNILTFAVNVTNVFLGGRYLERAWGSKEYAKVVAVAVVIPNLLVVPTYIIWGAVLRNPLRAATPITGAMTLQAACLVAFKQLVPEHTVSFSGFIKMRVKHFPAVFLLANTMSGIILGTDTALFLAWYGLITTWTYLRFIKRQPSLSSTGTGTGTGTVEGSKGDASETFAFATFFPNIMQPPIASACNQVYILFCNMRLITPFSDEAIAMGNEQAAARGEGGLPSHSRASHNAKGMSKREEAERRRALALRALDQRLNASSNTQPIAPINVTPAAGQEQDALGRTDYRPDDQ